jgi:nucleoside 2-deoxyribosyltransferase
MKTKIYLSYAMQFVKDEQLQRQRIDGLKHQLLNLGFEIYNPYTDEDNVFNLCGCKDRQTFIELQKKDFKAFMQCMKKIRDHDIQHLNSSDIIIAFIDPIVSGGLAGELTLAAYEDKTVYGIINPAEYKNISSWVMSCCDRIFDNTEQVIQQLESEEL